MHDSIRLHSFLSPYRISVNKLADFSGQSPQTLRNWYALGQENPKSYLIPCLIASYLWRDYAGKIMEPQVPFSPGNTLGDYLKPYKMRSEDLQFISKQSHQTLQNWLESPGKFLMIDILIDMVHWWRYVHQKGLISNYVYPEIINLLLAPITKNQDDTQFALSDFLKQRVNTPHKNRKLKIR